MGRADRGWAQRLLTWSWAGPVLTATISAARYFIRAERHEVLAWAELRDLAGRYRVEVGSFPTVALARAACERDAERRCRRSEDDRGPVDVRIAPGRRRRVRDVDRRHQGATACSGAGDAGAALDAALAAWAWVGEDGG